ncbi:MAG: lipopolysaccharide biosynthesis protein [Sphingobium sp.]|nr:lipopolysaccharide biosynthesis protein [Sphingobium sp.]
MNMQTSTIETTEDSALGAILPHLPTIILQRKWLFLIPALVGLIIGVAAAYLLPVTYQSKAVLLVEAPLLPEEIASDISSMDVIDQRMARIRQEILSRTVLVDVINRNSLYESEMKIKTYSEVIDEMRDAITIEPVTVNVQNNGRNPRGTIAFSITYGYSDPIKAQAVVQALVDKITQLNSSTQSQQAANTVQFLTDQSDELQQQISQLENTLLSVKSANGTALATGAIGYTGSPEAIQSQIMSIEATNASLKAQKDLASTVAQRDPGVQQAEATLAALRATYTETHPDVVLAKQRLEEAKRLAKAREDDLPVDRAQQIDQQIAFNNRQIATLRQAMGMASSSMAAARQAPVVQEQVSQLQEKLEGLNTQYRRVQMQLATARAGKRADDEQQGERLRPIEPPSTPEYPISPNRPVLIAGGLVVGLGLGLVLILFLELLHRPIRHISTVTRTVGEPPLVVIPTIFAPGERKAGFFSRLFSGGKDNDDDDDD